MAPWAVFGGAIFVLKEVFGDQVLRRHGENNGRVRYADEAITGIVFGGALGMIFGGPGRILYGIALGFIIWPNVYALREIQRQQDSLKHNNSFYDEGMSEEEITKIQFNDSIEFQGFKISNLEAYGTNSDMPSMLKV